MGRPPGPGCPPVSWAKPTSSQIPKELPVRTLSPSRPTLKPSYSQAVKPRKVTCDPEKLSRVIPRDASCGPLAPKPSCDPACDPTPFWSCALPRDQRQDQSRGIAHAVLGNKSQDQTRFRCASSLLIGTWKTVGTNQQGDPQRGSPGVSAVALKG